MCRLVSEDAEVLVLLAVEVEVVAVTAGEARVTAGEARVTTGHAGEAWIEGN